MIKLLEVLAQSAEEKNHVVICTANFEDYFYELDINGKLVESREGQIMSVMAFYKVWLRKMLDNKMTVSIL